MTLREERAASKEIFTILQFVVTKRLVFYNSCKQTEITANEKDLLSSTISKYQSYQSIINKQIDFFNFC